MAQDNGIFYLFDTTGHTHQIQQLKTQEVQILEAQKLRALRLEPQIQEKLQILRLRLQLQQPEQLQQLPIQLQQQSQLQQRLQAIKLQLQIQQLRIQRLQIHQDLRLLVLRLKSQEQQNKPLYYTSELTLDKEKISLSPNNGQQQGSGDTIQPVSLNPFGLDYQNGSSACGIWTSNVLAVASTYESIKDFIIKDEKEDYVAMFKSEFILKVSAKVAKELNAGRPEVKILQPEDNLPEGYCTCKVGNTLFAIDTTYNAGSCLNINSILLSVSQKELEFYNVDRINNEIIKEREQLIKKIEMEKTKCEAIIGMVTAEPDKQLPNFSEFVEGLVTEFNIKNNGTISDMVGGVKLYCEEQIKIIDNQLNHAQRADELFKPNCIRIVHEDEKTPINNTKQQSSDHGIGPR